ncbi:hydrolase 1, exosortase A system-associated [Sphingorhabdus sp. Alg231-15]|uniref:hydrolase 1, exosortase A system-associated n=1 Tax=Sphingorhabdus sp. Alg231-15 TaxID=1922222 RepID=UPI000D55CF31
MTRSFHQFVCEDQLLAGTLDHGQLTTGLLIVSGGNEIRAGAHAGMAKLAARMAEKGFPVFRYDRRGIGDSSGANRGFLETQADIQSALACFHKSSPHIEKIVAFGNCDASSALALFGAQVAIDGFILANPWVIENSEPASDAPTAPPPSAIRSRYWERLKNPQSIIDLLTGKINLRKLANGLKQAIQKQTNTNLSVQLQTGLNRLAKPCHIVLANRDTTARAFLAAWDSKGFRKTRSSPQITIASLDSASHSFADDPSERWLDSQILEMLENA